MKTAARRAFAVEGDLVVTRVAHHYTIGRVTADALTQTYLESLPDEMTAFNRACELAGKGHHVFQTDLGRHAFALIDCTERAAVATAFCQLRVWQRRHVNGVSARVMPASGTASWEVSVWRLGKRRLHIRPQLTLLTDAYDAADREAQVMGAHDCSHCGRWMPIKRRTRERTATPAGRNA